jgi:hypothetical protein
MSTQLSEIVKKLPLPPRENSGTLRNADGLPLATLLRGGRIRGRSMRYEQRPDLKENSKQLFVEIKRKWSNYGR